MFLKPWGWSLSPLAWEEIKEKANQLLLRKFALFLAAQSSSAAWCTQPMHQLLKHEFVSLLKWSWNHFGKVVNLHTFMVSNMFYIHVYWWNLCCLVRQHVLGQGWFCLWFDKVISRGFFFSSSSYMLWNFCFSGRCCHFYFTFAVVSSIMKRKG